MKPWYSPQSRQFNELARAMKNALAMIGFMFALLAFLEWMK